MRSSPRQEAALNDVVTALRQITQAIRLSSSAVQEALGISGAQLFVLQQLAAQPGASMGELAERTLTDQSSVSTVVSRLVERGRVARRTAAGDARRVELTLTPAGRALLKHAPELPQARLMTTLRELPLTDLAITARVLGRVASDLGAGQPTMFFEPVPAESATRRRSKAKTR
jgi:DNA-binding MarR family transcriptional regulator